jgi:hypothetical protein
LFARQTPGFLVSLGLNPYSPIPVLSPSSIIASFIILSAPSQPSPELTLVHPFGIKILKALAYLQEKNYLCIEMNGKGLISRMSDECLMKQETAFSFYIVYQAVMRKFTLAS